MDDDNIDDIENIDDVDAKVLDSKDRDSLSDSSFAVPGKRKLPIHDAEHVRNALARINQTEGLTPAEKKSALARIHRAAKKFGVKVEASSGPALIGTISAMRFEAVSLNLPDGSAHPNRMPFSGILTRIDSPSDRAPNGAHGKRVLLTHAAAEGALDSLMGMGIGITRDLNGHDAQNKIGVITAAHIDGDALMIEGFIYAADFPKEAIRIHLEQDQLGFSFEASNLSVDQPLTDPIVIRSCVFTGAAILMKNDAAYMTTSLAAAAAQEHEMAEVADALSKIMDVLTPLAGKVDTLSAQVAEMEKNPPGLQAVSAAVSKVEPLAAAVEALAEKMSAAGIGLHETAGHVSHLRRMASSMRAAAHMGTIPAAYHDSGSYFAGAAPVVQAPVVPVPGPAPIKVEDTAEFKALKAAFEAEIAASKDAVASVQTQVADLKAATANERPAPQRKTLSPEILRVMSRYDITAPEDGTTISVGKIDKVLADAGVTDIGVRMDIKTQLEGAGLLSMGH